jgi:hypothetical protein
MLQVTGRRSFGPALLVPGLLLLSPLGAIPGMASGTGLLVLIVAAQMVANRSACWLPRWLLRQHVATPRFCRALDRLQRPAAFIDRFIKPRMEAALRPPALQILAAVCGLMGLLTPMLELVPMADSVPALAISLLGLALVAHDGVLALTAAALCVVSVGLIAVIALG